MHLFDDFQFNSADSVNPDEINSKSLTLLNSSEVITNGIVLTPSALADFVVKRCMNYINPIKIIRAGDYCSGMGSFIYALNRIVPSVQTLSFEKNPILYELSKKYYSNKNNTILCLDALFETNEYNDAFDLLVGNPPYVRVQNISKELKQKLENNDQYKNFLEGSYDLSVAFIYKAIKLLKSSGICGLILPRKILSSSYGRKICNFISENTQILEIIDFCDNQLFADKTTYVSVLIFRKEKITKNYNFSYYKALSRKKSTILEIINSLENNKYIYDSSILKNFPWEFKSRNESNFIELIKRNGCPLTSIFSIAQGFRTGNNKAFIINNTFPDEPNIRKYVDGTNIKRGFLSNQQRIIWPYQIDNDKVELVIENEFSKNSPSSYSKLEQMLVNKGSKSWYAYTRPQSLATMYRPKIFLKEMMPRAEFAADTEGEICFSSGYALIPIQNLSKKDLIAWSLILSTDIMEYQYRCIGANLHSGWFRLYKNHAEKIILPKIEILQNEQFLKLIDNLIIDTQNDQLWKQLNEMIAISLGLSHKMIKSIQNELENKHTISMPTKKNISLERSTNKMMNLTDIISESAYPELSDDERKKYLPIELTRYNRLHDKNQEYRTLVTYQKDKNIPIQRWYKYTQGYSIDLVTKLLLDFNASSHDVVFDPFCGGGTTLLVSKKNNIGAIGCDVSPLSCWISRIKTYSWTSKNVQHISNKLEELSQGFDYDFETLQFQKFLLKAFHPNILAQTVYIQKWIKNSDLLQIEKDFLFLALISIQEDISMIRKHGSHYRFLNDYSHVGVNKLNVQLIEEDADITRVFKDKALNMLEDVSVTKDAGNNSNIQIFCTDIREFKEDITKASIVITSPPYLNRNNYFSQQKIELSLLNLISSNSEYSDLVKKSFCSHVEAKLPEKPICVIPEVNTIIEAVLKQKSNNAKIPHMIAGYFNDLNQFFEKLPDFLNSRAKIAFVVADCRWNGVVIPVDHLVCRIAEDHGFEPKKIIVARMKGNSPQQMREYGKIPVRESIVILENRNGVENV